MKKLIERKEAVRLYLYEGKSKAEICRRLDRSRPWLDRWLARYNPDDVDGSLSDTTPGPTTHNSRYSHHIRQQVVAMRKQRSQREQNPYALCGAAAIHYELQALKSPELPSVRTIHRWLDEAGLIEPPSTAKRAKESLSIPLPEATAVNRVQELDIKGPLYLRGSGQKHYLLVLCDCYSRRCALDVVTSRQAQGIVDFLVATWQWFGLPSYLQMDNALEFRGSNRYPRSFGKVVRLATAVGVEPVFYPPGEPWRNGCVERFNRFLDERLCAVDCAHLAALQAEAQACQAARNQTHRLEALKGQTPNEVVAQTTCRYLADDSQHQALSLPTHQGFVSFVRLVRKSGRITLGAGDRFMVDPDLAYSYVLARVHLDESLVVISYQHEPLLVYDFSPQTVGAWAMDNTSVSNA